MKKILIVFLFYNVIFMQNLVPSPPEIPALQAFAYDEAIYLYWDKVSENSIDPYSGYSDFEGYKLYRSKDGGETWGGLWQQLFNYSGEHVGWHPIVQYDYSEKQDTSHCIYNNNFEYNADYPCNIEGVKYIRSIDISGFDPLANWVNIGDNTGIYRSYIDNNVVNGIEYMYALTAYDMGLHTYTVEYFPKDTIKAEIFIDCGVNSENGDSLCSYDANWNPDFGNGEWDSSEELIDCGFNLTGDYICSNENDWSIGFGNGEWNGQYILYGDSVVWSMSNPDSLLGPNGIGLSSFETQRLHESLSDYNANGIWDEGEPFIDENNNGIWDVRIDPINVITITPNNLASNVTTFESFDVINDFVTEGSGNIGNGWIHPYPVNEAEIEPVLMRVEVNACLDKNGYGDQNGSFPTGCINEQQVDCALGCLESGPPSLYAYEIVDTINFKPKYVEEVDISHFSLDSIIFYSGLPGAVYTEDSLSVVIPDYIIKNFKLDYISIDESKWEIKGDYEANWTDWFNGFQLRLDNGFYSMPPGNWSWAPRFITSDMDDKNNSGYINWYEDPEGSGNWKSESELLTRLWLQFKYKTNLSRFYMRPNYSYKIEFSESLYNSASKANPTSGCKAIMPEDINGNQMFTSLPIKVTNMTLDKEVNMWHVDKGVEQGYLDWGDALAGECAGGCSNDEICVVSTCIPRVGNKNCTWEHNEPFVLQDTVYTTNNLEGDDALLWEFKLEFNHDKYLEYVGGDPSSYSNPWSAGRDYDEDEIVFHGTVHFKDTPFETPSGMFYKAKLDIEDSQKSPDLWYDDNGDYINDNPWELLLPWEDGEYIEFHPYKWFVDGDYWIMDLSVWGREIAIDNEKLDLITVSPNPYFIESRYNESPGENKIHFSRLPNNCILNIYTINGELVSSIIHNDRFRGDLFWNLKNKKDQLVAPGLYIYVVESEDQSISPKIGKFAIVR